MLPASYRLRRHAEIRRLYRKGQRWRHPLLILLAGSNNQNNSRFAVSVSRRVGNAVVRNRCKRQVREAIRSCLGDIEGGMDCLFLIRDKLPAASFTEVEEAVQHLLRRARLLREEV